MEAVIGLGRRSTGLLRKLPSINQLRFFSSQLVKMPYDYSSPIRPVVDVQSRRRPCHMMEPPLPSADPEMVVRVVGIVDAALSSSSDLSGVEQAIKNFLDDTSLYEFRLHFLSKILLEVEIRKLGKDIAVYHNILKVFTMQSFKTLSYWDTFNVQHNLDIQWMMHILYVMQRHRVPADNHVFQLARNQFGPMSDPVKVLLLTKFYWDLLNVNPYKDERIKTADARALAGITLERITDKTGQVTYLEIPGDSNHFLAISLKPTEKEVLEQLTGSDRLFMVGPHTAWLGQESVVVYYSLEIDLLCLARFRTLGIDNVVGVMIPGVEDHREALDLWRKQLLQLFPNLSQDQFSCIIHDIPQTIESYFDRVEPAPSSLSKTPGST